MRAILAFLLAVVTFPVVAFAAPARPDGPAPAPVTAPAPAADQAQSATTNVTNARRENWGNHESAARRGGAHSAGRARGRAHQPSHPPSLSGTGMNCR